MDDGRLKTGLGKALIGPDEELVLLAGISHAVGAVVVGHSKVLEQPRHLQTRQAAGIQHPGQRRVKSVRSAKPMRPMPVSAFEMHFYLPAGAQAASLRALARGRE